jgi:hypothetical protein
MRYTFSPGTLGCPRHMALGHMPARLWRPCWEGALRLARPRRDEVLHTARLLAARTGGGEGRSRNKSARLRYPRSVSMLLCRLTSIILNTEAPASAALVRNPLRSEWLHMPKARR